MEEELNITRFCFKRLQGRIYLIEYEDYDLFESLSKIKDNTLLEDLFGETLIDNIEDYIFEFPIKLQV